MPDSNVQGYFSLPPYSRILNFKALRPKLINKLNTKLDSLVSRLGIEQTKNEKCPPYIDLIKAEIELIKYILDNKKVLMDEEND